MEMSDVKPRIILVFFVRKKETSLIFVKYGYFIDPRDYLAEIVTKVFFIRE